MNRTAIALTGVVLLLSLTGCSGGTVADPVESASTRPPFQTTTPGPIPTATGTPAELPTAKWNAIIADLATRGVSGSAPEIVSATATTWQNGALGCPQPGQSYTQALIDGMQVIMSVDGKTYDYRFGADDTPVLCER
ncbi:hypothetical protein [Microbacterium rhizomatis]|uniref:Uncharacterized protein n=1 Tax=Microbacterium rhizomatis TaxID=1631477 RepID=A0A5J5J8P2_9MICO|nr:hypothetical protein [Microbacterium rhizomatis]KAA9111385.1 hypothetical protein F6B43_07350 [Microbacterium rhizomatis]